MSLHGGRLPSRCTSAMPDAGCRGTTVSSAGNLLERFRTNHTRLTAAQRLTRATKGRLIAVVAVSKPSCERIFVAAFLSRSAGFLNDLPFKQPKSGRTTLACEQRSAGLQNCGPIGSGLLFACIQAIAANPYRWPCATRSARAHLFLRGSTSVVNTL